jgi:surface carbohydrate biosynthesis protein
MSKKEVDVLFLFEKQGRELDALCLLKVLLEQKNLSVEIIQQNTQVYFALKNFKPKVVVLPFCYQNRSNNIYFRFWRSAIYISLNWEQFFYPGNKIAKTPRGTFATQRVIHFAWSDDYINLLKDSGVPQSNIHLIGSLPLSLLSEKYRDYFESKNSLAKKYNIDEKSKWIFFPENFGWAFYEDDMLNQMINDGQKAEDVHSMQKFSNDSFREIISWCVRLIEDHNFIVILRPRPATSVKEMKSRIEMDVGKIPKRLKIIKDLSVKDWIPSSDYVISSYSTTLIEAAVAGKNVIMMTPYAIPEVLKQVWHPYVKKCKTYEEFLASILALDEDNSDQLRSWARSNLYLNMEPPKVVAKIIANYCSNSESIKNKISTRELIVGDDKPVSYINFWLSFFISFIKIHTKFWVRPKCDNCYFEDFSALDAIVKKTTTFRKIMNVISN